MNLEKLPPTRLLRIKAYQRLRDLIMTRQISPGSFLTEEHWATELGISRTPLREVFAQLESEGLVARVAHRGAVVTQISPEEINAIYELRDLLERFAARRAALLAPREELQAIKQQFLQVTEQIERGDYSLYYASHHKLHEILLRYSGNSLLAGMLKQLDDRFQRIRSLAGSQPTLHVKQSFEEQRQLLDALIEQDPDRAELAIVLHLRNASKRISSQLSALTPPTEVNSAAGALAGHRSN